MVLSVSQTACACCVPVGGIPGEPGPGVGVDEEEVPPPHLLLDAVGLYAREAVQGLLEVRVDRGLRRAVEPLQLLFGSKGVVREYVRSFCEWAAFLPLRYRSRRTTY